MISMRQLIVCFWIFIIGALLWQFYDYDQGVQKRAMEHAKPQHFFFDAPEPSAAAPGAVNSNLRTADVRQIAYSTENNVPGSGSFTAHVVIKNRGNAKAIGVQILVRPFRESPLGRREGNGEGGQEVLSDYDPLAQIGQWAGIPDLDPGETYNLNLIFSSQPGLSPGVNPNPQIVFQTEKPNP